MRPCASVSGTRCTRCAPDSNLSLEYAPRPISRAIISKKPIIFARRGADWIEQRRFTADAATPRAALGWDVALDGRYLAAGSLGEERGAAYLFML